MRFLFRRHDIIIIIMLYPCSILIIKTKSQNVIDFVCVNTKEAWKGNLSTNTRTLHGVCLSGVSDSIHKEKGILSMQEV